MAKIIETVKYRLFVKHPHGFIVTVPPTAAPDIPAVPPGSRRPVVALLDSAIGVHPWLPESLVTSHSIAELNTSASFIAATSRSKSALTVDPHSDEPLGITEHGNFNAGLIRRQAPGAKILSIPVMDRGGEINPVEVTSALDAIGQRLAAPTPENFVDVVCLPFGFRPGASLRDTPESVAQKEAIARLAGAGVLVVASAGNYNTDDLVYPAAFAAEQPTTNPQLMLSVGALELDTDEGDKRASYSSFGGWVTHWAVGTAYSVVAGPPAGFALGEGTSFAAAQVAGELAKALSEIGGLNEVSPEAAIRRATHVRANQPRREPIEDD